MIVHSPEKVYPIVSIYHLNQPQSVTFITDKGELQNPRTLLRYSKIFIAYWRFNSKLLVWLNLEVASDAMFISAQFRNFYFCRVGSQCLVASMQHTDAQCVDLEAGMQWYESFVGQYLLFGTYPEEPAEGKSRVNLWFHNWSQFGAPIGITTKSSTSNQWNFLECASFGDIWHAETSSECNAFFYIGGLHIFGFDHFYSFSDWTDKSENLTASCASCVLKSRTKALFSSFEHPCSEEGLTTASFL